MLIDYTVSGYISLLASDAPSPGGGSAAALTGALGAALINMVGRLTQGREKYAQYADFNAELLERAGRVAGAFQALVDEDAAAFDAMSAAYKLPKSAAAEKAARKRAIQAALTGCINTPLKMMELCVEALELTRSAVGKTNKNVASDLGVAALCLKAAMQSAWLNVLVNLSGVEDAEYAASRRAGCEALLAGALPLADEICAMVIKGM